MVKVCVIYNNWVQPLGYVPYSKLEEVKDFCVKKPGFFFQLETIAEFGRAANIPDDKGDYRGIPKQKKNTHSLVKGELHIPHWELLVKVNEEKIKDNYPPAGEFIIPASLKASEETSRGF